ncbi:hypothetical protein N183_31905 [Sinorhizobium sp. Sb3]|jgi:hypothetical protein|uniref:DUF982 domain-containing protein n=2 Tax=Ensifer TaxID=106591 RepID=UPI0007251E6B|nr:hypothetical protein N183_31905 [Sinorhizobium sp. Sb3]
MMESWNKCVIIELPELDGAQIVWTPNKATVLLSKSWPVDSLIWTPSINAGTQ